MSKSIVREALEQSVTCSPVSCQISHDSTVPNSSSPRSARSRATGTWSRIQRIFVPEKYASISRPVDDSIRSSSPACLSVSHSSAVRRHCQTMAL